MRQGQNLRQTDFLKFWFRHFINFGFDPKALTSQKLSRAKAPGSSRRPGGGFGPTSEQCAENISIRRTLSCGYVHHPVADKLNRAMPHVRSMLTAMRDRGQGGGARPLLTTCRT